MIITDYLFGYSYYSLLISFHIEGERFCDRFFFFSPLPRRSFNKYLWKNSLKRWGWTWPLEKRGYNLLCRLALARTCLYEPLCCKVYILCSNSCFSSTPVPCKFWVFCSPWAPNSSSWGRREWWLDTGSLPGLLGLYSSPTPLWWNPWQIMNSSELYLLGISQASCRVRWTKTCKFRTVSGTSRVWGLIVFMALHHSNREC